MRMDKKLPHPSCVRYRDLPPCKTPRIRARAHAHRTRLWREHRGLCKELLARKKKRGKTSRAGDCAKGVRAKKIMRVDALRII